MDDFREWLSDNLRYILLGLAVILIIVVAFFAFKLISGNSGGGNKTPKETESESHQAAVVVDTEDENGTNAAGTGTPREALAKNDPAILELTEKYYQALEQKDMETLKQLVDPVDEAELQKKLDSSYVEGYQNISVYSKKGLTEGTYVVYAYYEGKLIGFDTLVPSLTSFYLTTRADGGLVLSDPKNDESVQNYIKEVHADEDVQRLRQDVQDKYNAAEAADPALKQRLEEISIPETESVLPNSSDVDVEVNKQVAATDVCNVRADSVETAEVLGQLAVGETVTRTRKLDNGWSEIRYGERTAYVKSDYLTEDIGSAQNQTQPTQ